MMKISAVLVEGCVFRSRTDGQAHQGPGPSNAEIGLQSQVDQLPTSDKEVDLEDLLTRLTASV